MLLRLWHKLYAHSWKDSAFRMPIDERAGRLVAVTTFIRQCRCGAVQSAQVMGDPVEHTNELDALRKMAGLCE